MATVNATLRWVASLDADVDTDYRVESDASVSGTFATVVTQDASDRGDGSYTPYTTTLNGAVLASATTLVLTDGTSFSLDDYVALHSATGREVVQLGTKSTHTFEDCTRHVGTTLAQDWSSGATVYHMHESYLYSLTWPVGRYLVRCRVFAVNGGEDAVALEIPIVVPPVPPTNNLITVWGIIDKQGTPVSGVEVKLMAGDSDNWHPDTGELLYREEDTATSDGDGFWYFFVPRTKIGGDAYQVTVTEFLDGELTWSITTIPDGVYHVNLAET